MPEQYQWVHPMPGKPCFTEMKLYDDDKCTKLLAKIPDMAAQDCDKSQSIFLAGCSENMLEMVVGRTNFGETCEQAAESSLDFTKLTKIQVRDGKSGKYTKCTAVDYAGYLVHVTFKHNGWEKVPEGAKQTRGGMMKPSDYTITSSSNSLTSAIATASLAIVATQLF